MKVYRVAHHTDELEGPYNFQDYNSNPLIAAMLDAHCADYLGGHTTPQTDRLLGGIDSNEFCGLDSLENLRLWFAGFCKGLGQLGFVINVYEADTARVGRNGQTLFILDRAELIDTLVLG